MTYQQHALAKKQAVDAQIPAEWILPTVPTAEEAPNCSSYLDKIVPAEELEITSSNAITLIDKLSKGQLTALQVTKAFCHRTALVHQLTTCCSEIFFDKALERAKFLDDHFAKTGTPIGRLHGLPISLKDQFNVEGYDSTMGFVGRINHPKTKDEQSLLVDILLKEGAVLYVKTTLPTTMMSADTYSHIYGYTLNSVNRHVSPGGSSGGEGSLIAAGGSVIGFGTDIGGSVRIPSALTGLYGLRGSSGRFPYLNVSNTGEDNPILSSVVGPMCSHLEDLEMITKVVMDNEPWLVDTRTPPIPWRSVQVPQKLKVGLLVNRKDFRPVPAVARVLQQFVDKLRGHGHEVVEIDGKLPVDVGTMSHVIGNIYGINGYSDIKDDFKKGNEPYTPALEHIAEEEPADVLQEWEWGRSRYNCQVDTTKYLRQNGFDCILTPVWGEGAFTPGNYNYTSNFCTMFNFLDYSSITIPAGVYEKTDTWEEKDVQTANEKMSFEQFDLDKFAGTPIGLQIACFKYEEEKCIEICKVFSSY